MIHDIMLEQTKARDLTPLFIGHEVCAKKQKFGPHARDYYLIHFCINGKGTLQDKYGVHEISAGELFIIRPGEITTYFADGEKPWEYAWIAFQGEIANIFNTDRSTYPVPLQFGAEIRELSQNVVTAPSVYIALLFRLIYTLFNEQKATPNTAEKIRQYIHFNYMQDLTLQQLSHYFGFERSYLYRIFQRAYGMSIKAFIIKTRMEQARVLLERGYSVGETAFAVGYKDPFNFSKAYKRLFGVPPKAQKHG